MPKLLITDQTIRIAGQELIVTYNKVDPHFFTVTMDWMSQSFFIPSCCDATLERDLNIALVFFGYETQKDFVRLILKYQSTLWLKVYYIDVYDSHVEYYFDLVGSQTVANLHIFEGISALNFEEHHFTKHFNDHKATPYRTYSTASPIRFRKVFNPEPNVYSQAYFESFEYSLISVNSDFADYCGGNFYFNPGILCYLIGSTSRQPWLSLGLAVRPGQYLFSDYEYVGGAEFGLNVNYCGLLQVSGSFQSPKLIMFYGSDEQQALKRYVNYLRETEIVPSPASKTYRWWNGPFICPVGYQYYQTDLFRIRSPKERSKDLAGYFACTQVNCDNFIDLIDRHGIDWRIFVIDVKWFINAGQKVIDIGRWPDMRAFVDSIHLRNKRAIIWWSPWDTEGWAENECITYYEEACGIHRNRPGRFSKFDNTNDKVKVAPDITLPSVQDRVSRQLNLLLGEKGIDLDGLKLDHTASTPGLYGMHFPEGSKRIYGIELLHYYQEFLYKQVKCIKSDALVVGQSPNPYFSDCIDMIRLGDTYTHDRHSIVRQMDFRFKMAKIANSNWLIDMDGWPIPSLEALDEYIRFQVETGVPSLYYATHLDTTGERIPDEILSKIRMLWDQYQTNLDA